MAHVIQEDERSIVPLLKSIGQDIRRLLQQEVALMREELREEAAKARTALASALLAAVFAVTTVILAGLSLAHYIYLASGAGAAPPDGLALWAAMLIAAGAGLVLTALAGLLAVNRFKAIRAVPADTVQSMKDNARWAKEVTTQS